MNVEFAKMFHPIEVVRVIKTLVTDVHQNIDLWTFIFAKTLSIGSREIPCIIAFCEDELR